MGHQDGMMGHQVIDEGEEDEGEEMMEEEEEEEEQDFID